MNSIGERLRTISEHPQYWAWCKRAILAGFALCTLAAALITWANKSTIGFGLFIAGFVIATLGILAGQIKVVAKYFGARR